MPRVEIDMGDELLARVEAYRAELVWRSGWTAEKLGCGAWALSSPPARRELAHIVESDRAWRDSYALGA